MTEQPTIQHHPEVGRLFEQADAVYFNAFIATWESLSSCQKPVTIADCDARLIRFAGSALLGEIGNRHTGPASYAEWGCIVDGKYTERCGWWGVDPEA